MSSAKKTAQVVDEVDVALIGAGIMSATLGAMLRELEPSWTQMVFERLDGPALESSSPWNNAGTGHSALCELNYTPEKNGRIDISKALGINEKFQKSRQFWSHQLNNGILTDPSEFINPVPHVSFAQGEIQVDYLKRRYDVLSEKHMFPGMQFSADDSDFAEKMPLMAKGRDFSNKVAISWTDAGTDVNFGALTKQFLTAAKASGTEIRYGHEVIDIKRDGSAWKVYSKNKHTGDITVSGLWLRSKNPELIEQHQAKVYGKAAVGAPPMSVPHLDTRVIDGEKGLLFGPYGGWSPKFLKKGTYLDLFKSIRPDNITSDLGVAVQEFGLTKYLVDEVRKSFSDRVEALREYVPEAKESDWETVIAGQRVQVIKPAGAPQFGSLEFGTTLVNNQEGNIAGLLGASPGASIAPAVMLELLERCFGEHMIDWADKIREMVPSYGIKLRNDEKLYDEMWEYTQKTLKLDR